MVLQKTSKDQKRWSLQKSQEVVFARNLMVLFQRQKKDRDMKELTTAENEFEDKMKELVQWLGNQPTGDGGEDDAEAPVELPTVRRRRRRLQGSS